VRVVVQRVTRAAVTVDGEVVGALDRPGLAVLVGERSALDEGAPVLVVSQFTLYADTRKGRRPSWSAAAPGPVAEPLVEAFAAALQGLGLEVATGRFGADMAVSLVNDGPVTLLLEA
jgi:D-tyrosyl-tRNA(Tyr) deacylase